METITNDCIFEYPCNKNMQEELKKSLIDVKQPDGMLISVKKLNLPAEILTLISEMLDYSKKSISTCHGHLEVVKWLHKNRNEGCTAFAI